MLLGSYTITLLKEEGQNFTVLYRNQLKTLLNNSDFVQEVALLEMATQIDPGASTFSLQLKFDSESNYADFSTNLLPELLQVLDNKFPQQYAYFHTLLKYV